MSIEFNKQIGDDLAGWDRMLLRGMTSEAAIDEAIEAFGSRDASYADREDIRAAISAAMRAAGDIQYDTHCPTCDAPEPWHTATCAVVHVKVAEPSDAQVAAALDAYQGQPTRVEAMRAALRAAWEER